MSIEPPRSILLDLTHTSHTRARTGVQRVTRSLLSALDGSATAITHDPYLRGWRPLEPWEHANLNTDIATEKRGARWPLSARIRSHLRRILGRSASPLLPSIGSSALLRPTALVVPEIFSAATAAALPALFAVTPGPRVAIFHDAIALKLPELTPAKTVARFPAYLHELLAFDGIAAVSEDSRDSLLAYWRWLGASSVPPVQTISLAHPDQCSVVRYIPVAGENPVVLSVGSIEGRKNHLALLDACETLWQRGARFELHLIGLAQPQTGAAALARLRALQAAGRPVRYDGAVTDAALDAAYARCAFTVYPSLLEGFGLPVLESLAHGKPCICSARGAIGESARNGGCLALERVDAPSLAAAIERLLATPAELASLTAQAHARPARTWRDYTHDLLAWLHELPRRN